MCPGRGRMRAAGCCGHCHCAVGAVQCSLLPAYMPHSCCQERVMEANPSCSHTVTPNARPCGVGVWVCLRVRAWATTDRLLCGSCCLLHGCANTVSEDATQSRAPITTPREGHPPAHTSFTAVEQQSHHTGDAAKLAGVWPSLTLNACTYIECVCKLE